MHQLAFQGKAPRFASGEVKYVIRLDTVKVFLEDLIAERVEDAAGSSDDQLSVGSVKEIGRRLRGGGGGCEGR